MIDFEHIEKTVLDGFETAMSTTPQSAKYHAEGDVHTHTLMVVEALKSLPEYQRLSETQRHILNFAALLHDVGKIGTTINSAGDWESPHYSATGSRMVRELLWKNYGQCGTKELMDLREVVCLLGRKCDDQQQMLDQIALCEELAKEEGCYDR